MNRTILVRSSGRFSPVNIGIPLKPRSFEAVKRTQPCDGLAKIAGFMIVEKTRQQSVNDTPLPHRRQDHEHNGVALWKKIRKTGKHHS